MFINYINYMYIYQLYKLTNILHINFTKENIGHHFDLKSIFMFNMGNTALRLLNSQSFN